MAYIKSQNTDPTKAIYGEQSSGVLALQQSLNKQYAGQTGYTPLKEDGMYGDLTKAATTYKSTAAPQAVPNPVIPPPGAQYPPATDQTPSRPILYNDPDEPALVTAKSVDDIQKEKLNQAQEVIGNLNKYYDTLVNEGKVLGEENLRKTNALSSLTGLGGSSDANSAAMKTEEGTKKNIDKVNQERQVAISQVLSKIQTDAVEEARNQRIEARQSEQDRITYREKAQSKAVENLTLLSKTASGATLEGLAATLKPEEYAVLIKNVGGEAMAKAILFENRPKDTVMGTPQLIGGKMVQAFQTADGKIKYESVDLPEGVAPDNIQSIEKTDAGIFIINKDGTWKKITGSAKPVAPGTVVNTTGALKDFPADIQAAAQSIHDGKSKLNEYPSAKRLQINQAASLLYNAEGGNELAQSAYDAVVNLENDPGFSHAIGTNIFFGYGKNASGSNSASYIAELDKLKANIKLVNIKYLKGTGALSDAEGKTLEDAGTSLSTKQSEVKFKEELARIKAALLKASNVSTGDKKNISSDGTALEPGAGSSEDPLGLFDE